MPKLTNISKLAKIPSQLHNYCRGYKLFWRQADGDYQPFGPKKVHLEWVTITEMETVNDEIKAWLSELIAMPLV